MPAQSLPAYSFSPTSALPQASSAAPSWYAHPYCSFTLSPLTCKFPWFRPPAPPCHPQQSPTASPLTMSSSRRITAPRPTARSTVCGMFRSTRLWRASTRLQTSSRTAASRSCGARASTEISSRVARLSRLQKGRLRRCVVGFIYSVCSIVLRCV